jgi:hypothetical protein
VTKRFFFFFLNKVKNFAELNIILFVTTDCLSLSERVGSNFTNQ